MPELPRGQYRAGPLRIRLTDPFHMVDVVRSFTATTHFIVTPIVDPLPAFEPPRSYDIGDNAGSHSIGAHGADDASTREYRMGDDLRRIHWRSTARAGELMVRREEQPWQAHGLIVLDNRLHAHHGDGPGSSFEYACSAAASIGVQLLHSNFTVHLDRGEGRVTVSGPDVDDGLLLDELAVADLERTADIPGQVGTNRHRDLPRGGGVVVAVLGAMTIADAESVVRAHRGSGQRIAIVLDTRTWSASGQVANAPGDHGDAAARVLESSGWRVLRVSAGTALADVWNVSGPSLAGAR
jgi:uncharacterized protein (DUF58 family)